MLLFAGCASGLQEIKPRSDLSSDENKTFVYGMVETSPNTRFTMKFRSAEDQKLYAFTVSKSGILPFGTKEIPFSMRMKPGKWTFVDLGLSKGSATNIPAGVNKEFEVREGMGNFLGRFSGKPTNGAGAAISFSNISVSGDKAGVDSVMAEEYSGFDAGKTVAIELK